MKKFFLSTVSALALAHGASAADLAYKAPPAPIVIPTWAGWYVGIQGGVASHRGRFTDVDNLTFAPAPGAQYESSKTGGLFGANAGYNVQTGMLVFGIEGDWNWLGAKAGTTYPGLVLTTVTSFDVHWLATVRGRIGLAADATLFYVTGGAAFANVNNSASVLFGPGLANTRGTFSQDTTKVGWTVGGGIEHMFTRNWTVRAEVRYVDLGRSTVNCGIPCNAGIGTYRGEFRNSLLLGLVGIDFKF